MTWMCTPLSTALVHTDMYKSRSRQCTRSNMRCAKSFRTTQKHCTAIERKVFVRPPIPRGLYFEFQWRQSKGRDGFHFVLCMTQGTLKALRASPSRELRDRNDDASRLHHCTQRSSRQSHVRLMPPPESQIRSCDVFSCATCKPTRTSALTIRLRDVTNMAQATSASSDSCERGTKGIAGKEIREPQ